jgi:glutamate-1-semialdehyde 2,1-aminomutase/spore coat polysaccharide biosynthesis protein SpsF
MGDHHVNTQRSLARSKEWLERSSRVIPGCAQTFSKSPISFVQGVAPNFLSRGQGATVWDVDENSYFDYTMGLGAVILGHADEAVNEAARKQLADGLSFGLPHTIEVEVAELLRDRIPCAEMVRFGKNGSDVTAAAIRVSRAHTGRDYVACCGYHGWQDWYIGSTSRNRGVPQPVQALTLAFRYGDIDALHQLFRDRPQQIACVIMEPVTFDSPPAGYLENVKELCAKNGALLIFDEIVTGFRLAPAGAQDHFGVVPDLACFGKAIANGFPLAALVGRAGIMRLFEDVFFSTTHGGEAVSLAACKATIHAMDSRNGADHLWRIGKRLQDGANSLLGSARLAERIACVGLPPFTSFRFQSATDEESVLLRSYFLQEAVKEGLLTQGNHMLSVAHDDQVVDITLASYARVFDKVAEVVRCGNVAARLEGPPVRPIMRRA